MRPISALTGVALTLALLVGATSPGTAAPAAAATGSVTKKDKAGDHDWAPAYIENARAKDADLRKVSVRFNADRSIVVDFTVDKLRRKRTGPSPTGVQQAVTRKYDLTISEKRGSKYAAVTIGYWDPMEGKPVAGTKPYVNMYSPDPALSGNLQCDAGSVKFLESKNTLQVRVPGSCHDITAEPGEKFNMDASTQSAVKYYDGAVYNSTGGGIAAEDSIWPLRLTTN